MPHPNTAIMPSQALSSSFKTQRTYFPPLLFIAVKPPIHTTCSGSYAVTGPILFCTASRSQACMSAAVYTNTCFRSAVSSE